jgi:hypothetical protein
MATMDLVLACTMDTWDVAMGCARGRSEEAMGSTSEHIAWYQEATWTLAWAHGMARAQTMGTVYWSMLLGVSMVGKNHGWYPYVYGTTMVLTDLSLVYTMDSWDVAV